MTSPHDDTLVIKSLIARFEVSCILVDRESSTEIMYHPAFQKMSLTSYLLTPTDAPLVGFNGDEVRLERTIDLPCALEQCLGA